MIPDMVAAEAKTLSTIPDGAQVLDLGGGSGRKCLSLRARGCRILAADLDFAQARASGGIQADAVRLPFRDAVFDAVAVLRMIECLPRKGRAQALSETLRVTRPGGRLAAILTCPPPVPRLGGAYGPVLVRKALRGIFYGLVLASNLLADAFRSTGLSALEPRDRRNPGNGQAFFHHFRPEELAGEISAAGWTEVRVLVSPPLPDPGWRRLLPFPGPDGRTLNATARRV